MHCFCDVLHTASEEIQGENRYSRTGTASLCMYELHVLRRNKGEVVAAVHTMVVTGASLFSSTRYVAAQQYKYSKVLLHVRIDAVL